MCRLIIIPLLIFIFASCKHAGIKGKWKIKTDIISKYKQLKDIDKDAGDLTISADSTYFMKGYSSAVSTTPGWHVGGDETGTWSMPSNDTLCLFPDIMRALIPASVTRFGRNYFKIVELSKSKLILLTLDSAKYLSDDGILEYERQK
jgi:hypothetical protein